MNLIFQRRPTKKKVKNVCYPFLLNLDKITSKFEYFVFGLICYLINYFFYFR